MIHTVTTIEKITKIAQDSTGVYSLPFPDFGDIHCAGYYNSVEDALYFMNKNSAKLHNNMNEYCIIEEYEEGLFNPTTNRYLFKWTNGKYEQIDEPITIHKVTNFAMG
jgi:hypothetical protein